MFTPDEYYNIVEFTGAGTRRNVVVEEIQQQQPRIVYPCVALWLVNTCRWIRERFRCFKHQLKVFLLTTVY